LPLLRLLWLPRGSIMTLIEADQVLRLKPLNFGHDERNRRMQPINFDLRSPTISVSASSPILWPPNGKLFSEPFLESRRTKCQGCEP
jgi:hypothetical protein